MHSRCDLWGVISALLVSCYASRDPTHYLSSKRYPLWSVVSWAEQRIFDRLVENPSHYLRIPSDAQQGPPSAVSKRNILTTWALQNLSKRNILTSWEFSIFLHHRWLWRLWLISAMLLTTWDLQNLLASLCDLLFAVHLPEFQFWSNFAHFPPIRQSNILCQRS